MFAGASLDISNYEMLHLMWFFLVSCYEAAEVAGIPLFCAFNRRFDVSHAGVKKAADEGEIGKIHMVKVCSRDSPIPSEAYLKISGGIYHDCAVHDIDMMMWILKTLS